MASQAIVTADTQPPAMLSAEGQHFALMQRKAALFARSPLIPETLRNGGEQQALANCYIGLTMAEAMGENPLTVLQNIHVVKGKAGFSAQFMIARANASGVFAGRIDWRLEGKGEALSVTAYAHLKGTGQEVSVTCDMAMAKAEGWTSNPKYKSMPEVMLRYRSATFLVRFYAPDVMFGYQTAEEVEDVLFAAGPDLNARPSLTAAMIENQARPAEPKDAASDGEPENGSEVASDQGEGATLQSAPSPDTITLDSPNAEEGRAEEDHGDQHDDDDPRAALVARLVNEIGTAATKAAIDAAEAEFLRHRPAMEPDHVSQIEAMIGAARKRVRGENAGRSDA